MGELMMLSAAQGCGPDVGAGPHGHGHSYTDQQQQLQLQQLAVKRQRSQLGDMLLQPWQFSAKRFRREAIADMQQLLAQHHHQMHFRTPIPMSMPQVGTRRCQQIEQAARQTQHRQFSLSPPNQNMQYCQRSGPHEPHQSHQHQHQHQSYCQGQPARDAGRHSTDDSMPKPKRVQELLRERISPTERFARPRNHQRQHTNASASSHSQLRRQIVNPFAMS